MFPKNHPTLVRAWAMYDWANSAFSLVIVSTIFPIYYDNITEAHGGLVPFFGTSIKSSSVFSYAVSLAFLLIAFISPILSAIADSNGNKKAFMKFFCYLGAASCGLLFFFTDIDNVWLGIGGFVGGLVGFSGSIVFYNAYLPEIATEERFDGISAKGFALGYVGSVLLLLTCLSTILKPEWFGGISPGLASRLAFLATGLWWAGFAQYSFYHLPSNVHRRSEKADPIAAGFRELKKIMGELSSQHLLKKFLLAFFFYNMGVQTVMYVATIFGKDELQLPSQALIITILILQIVAIGGAYIFSRLSERYGNTRALSIAVVIWVGICIGAYFVSSGNEFYLLATVVGSVMGGVQSLSRATYAKLMPDDTPDTASYFSFYDVVEKLSIVLGTFAYGLIDQITGSMRNSVLALMVFFIIGLVFLLGIPSRKVYESKVPAQ